MPSGYTCAIADGEITELRPFIMRCARAFGALIDMRDDPMDAPIPDKLKGSQYHIDKLAELRAEFARMSAMNAFDCDVAAKLEVKAWKDRTEQRAKDYAAQRQRYLDMITKVEAWEGAPEGIKDFALQQLRESLRFDCPDEVYVNHYDRSPPGDGATWHAKGLASLSSEIQRCTMELAADERRTAERQAWLDQLRESLPADAS